MRPSNQSIDHTFLNKIIEIQNELIKADFNLDEFMQLVVDRMQSLTDANGTVIELAEDQEMVYRAATGTVKDYIGLRLPIEGSISGLCVQSKALLYAADTENDPRVNKEACRKIGAGSLIVAPLIHNGEAIGVLKIVSQSANAFTENDMQTILLMANFIASGLNHQLYFEHNKKLIHENIRLMNLKNEFVANVSHELRTPLTSVQGSITLLAAGLAGELSPRAMQLLKISKENIDRLIRLINDLLDIQKIESGRMEYILQRVDILDLIKDAISKNHAYAQKFHRNLKLVKAHSGIVNVDYDKIIQVVTNLISNAVKFSSSPDIIINIEKKEKYIRVEVINEGVGIPIEAQSKLFQKFIQLQNKQTSDVKGSGLGLAISKEIIESHHGNIGFSTDANKNTIFYFELPMSQA